MPYAYDKRKFFQVRPNQLVIREIAKILDPSCPGNSFFIDFYNENE